MGFWKRLRGEVEERPLVKAAVVGDSPEAERLASAFQVCPGIELIGCELLEYGDGVIRRPRVRPALPDMLDELIGTPGLQAIEIAAPPGEGIEAARRAIRAGLFTSIDCPPDSAELAELDELAKAYHVPLRVRLHPLYYPPYREMKRLADEQAVGLPISLRIMTRRGKGTDMPDDLDPGRWLREREAPILAMAEWLMGPVEKVHARLGKPGPGPAPSSVIMWKHKATHQYGYMHLDFCPGFRVKTFTDPAQRFLELTCAGGLVMATRGEAQAPRMPALMVRGKSTFTGFEMIPDDWLEAYRLLAEETVEAVGGAAPCGSPARAMAALELIAAAERSAAKGEEEGLHPV